MNAGFDVRRVDRILSSGESCDLLGISPLLTHGVHSFRFGSPEMILSMIELLIVMIFCSLLLMQLWKGHRHLSIYSCRLFLSCGLSSAINSISDSDAGGRAKAGIIKAMPSGMTF
jgi:hypothetical protein